MPTVADILSALDTIAPPSLCLGTDPRGLLIGDPQHPVPSLGVALDVTGDIVNAAADHGHTMLVTHHPLIYHPLRSLRTTDPFPSTVVSACVRANMSVACAHTNWDVAPGGINDVLANLLGLTDLRPLRKTQDTELVMIVVFVPVESAETVRQALFAAGAGAIGNYDECAFNLRGTGMFRPLAGSNPTLGTHDVRESVDEIRIECIAQASRTDTIIAAARQAHPYEEMAHFVTPLVNRIEPRGIGRIGVLPEPLDTETFLENVGIALANQSVRSSAVSRSIRVVAVCGGAGAEFMGDALAKGADALVTSDIRHHEFVEARERGFLLVDAGHAETETPGTLQLARRLQSAFPGIAVRFHSPDGTSTTV
ncbi:MAG: Nif3-like dinuclear metal center hexameric protein [Armatimonadaceae bacterium]